MHILLQDVQPSSRISLSTVQTLVLGSLIFHIRDEGESPYTLDNKKYDRPTTSSLPEHSAALNNTRDQSSLFRNTHRSVRFPLQNFVNPLTLGALPPGILLHWPSPTGVVHGNLAAAYMIDFTKTN